MHLDLFGTALAGIIFGLWIGRRTTWLKFFRPSAETSAAWKVSAETSAAWQKTKGA